MSLSLAARIKQSSQLSGTFVLRSGKTSDTYFDKYQFESDPKLLHAIAEAMVPLLPPDTEALAGMEMGGIPVATMLGHLTGLPVAFIRKEPKSYGTCRYAEGVGLAGKRFVVVEDVVSSGGAILDALAKLKADRCFPAKSICVIDRQTGGKEALAKEGLELVGLFSFDDIVQS